ncbi:hypothetical protein D9M73_211420 [compost metagenome]
MLTLTALGLQALPFAGLRQTIAGAAEQFGRPAQITTLGENFLQYGIGLGRAAILGVTTAQVALLDLVLGEQELAAVTGLFEQQ